MSAIPGGAGPPTQADPEAMRLAREMFGRDDVMADILDETIPADGGGEVTESGRTMCGPENEIHGPLARFPSAVELASCPRGVSGGTWHTHVTKKQLRDPSNSLPDTANVIFGDIAVSAVVGTQSIEAVVAPANTEQGRQAFRDALGADVNSTEDVVNAIISREIEDAPAARERVRREMSDLFVRESVNFPDLDARLDRSGVPAKSPMSFEMVDARHHAVVTAQIRQNAHRKSPYNPHEMREFARGTNDRVRRVMDEYDVKGQALGAAISEAVSRAFRSLL